MSDPIGTFSGLSSGIQWRDMVDQIMKIEQQRRLDPITARQSSLTKQADAWHQLQSVVAKFRDAARALRNTASFEQFSASAAKSPTSSRDLVGVSASAGATPGRFDVEVLATARAEKIGGGVVTGGTTPLGIAGSFALNGRVITVVAQDTLASVRDKINAANGGTIPSGVSASIVSATGGSRLVLTADETGVAGVETTDDGTGTLVALGLADNTTSANLDDAGAAQSFRLSSDVSSVGATVALTPPAATTIRVGGNVIAVDLAADSLQDIAQRINTASGNPSLARVASETVRGKTTYRLVTDATVEVDAAGTPATSARALAVLGFTQAGRGSVAQSILSANSFVDVTDDSAATGTTLLTNLKTNGQSLGVVAGDTITIGGTRGDGTTVTRTLAVGAGTTVADLVSALNDATTGFGAGTRTATASISGGRIALTDNTAGDSRLGLQLAVTHAGGATVSLGAVSTNNGGVAGITREIVSGANAVVRVDGQTIARRTNTITNAIDGVTLTALSAEAGTTVAVSVTRDADAIAKVAQDFVSAYNAVRQFVTSASSGNGPLVNNTAVKSIATSLTSRLLESTIGATSGFATASMVGVGHDRNGVLSLDVKAFKAALQSNYGDVRKLFTLDGTASDAEVSFVGASDKTTPRAAPYAVAVTQAATLATVTGASWTTYATAGAPDTMSFTDAASGAVGSIALANGDTIGGAVSKLNAMFGAQHLRLAASRTVDNRITIASLDYGTTGGFSVAYTPGAGGDGTAALGIAAQAYAGLNVAGTINGVVATGSGQILTGAVDDPSEGLSIRYSGTTARAAGTVAFVLGVGGALERDATTLARDSTGIISSQEDSTRSRADALNLRADDIQQRLDQRRAALIKQFVAMESALAKAQSIGATISAQLGAMQSR